VDAVWLVNGEPVAVDPRDRGLAYGDGLFETMACRAGRIRWIEYHLDRLSYGARRLSIPLPRRDVLRAEIEAQCPSAGSAVVKMIVTRGIGERGYRPPEPAVATRILGITDWPDLPAAHYTRGVALKICALRLGENPQLAGLKHLCRLEQVLAQMELIGSMAQEGLVRGSSGFVAGGISSNLFAVSGKELLTPDLSRCGVRGVMRRIVLERAPVIDLQPRETNIDMDTLLRSDEVFITNAVIGIKPVNAIDGHSFSVGAKTRALMRLLDNDPERNDPSR
jgi:4-amino-4-deoxychorismate lyase